ncbi:MAG: acetylglutamate kinase [Anaerolineae bacterium]
MGAEMTAPIVIKIGGNELEKPGFIPELARVLAGLIAGQPCILVHGGGRSVDALLERLGIEPKYYNGQRITDEAALRAVEMVLSGSVNKGLVLALLEAGVDAIGLSGVDRGLLRVEPWAPEMGRVGRIVSVRADVLNRLCGEGVVPVISPISVGADGCYNVNADHAAGAIAAAVGAARLVFLTDVPGVRVGEAVAAQLGPAQVEGLIAASVINGGMIPKVRAALAALDQGVAAVQITSLAGLQNGAGTTLTPDAH